MPKYSYLIFDVDDTKMRLDQTDNEEIQKNYLSENAKIIFATNGTVDVQKKRVAAF